jgi:hypothetical protein
MSIFIVMTFHPRGGTILCAWAGRLFLPRLVLVIRSAPTLNHLLDVVLDIFKFWLELQVSSEFFVATLYKASGTDKESAPESGFQAFDVRISIIIMQRIVKFTIAIADSILKSIWKTTILVRENPREIETAQRAGIRGVPIAVEHVI